MGAETHARPQIRKIVSTLTRGAQSVIVIIANMRTQSEHKLIIFVIGKIECFVGIPQTTAGTDLLSGLSGGAYCDMSDFGDVNVSRHCRTSIFYM